MKDAAFLEKKEILNRCMDKLTEEPLAVAFSGGVDSSLLLALSKRRVSQVGDRNTMRLLALTADSTIHSRGDLFDAKKQATELGCVHVVVGVDPIKDAKIAENPENRCYLCKKHLFEKMLEKAAEYGIFRLIEGTNLDDTHAYRPGQKAVKELGIRSPLLEAGFTKEDVRAYAKELGISSADKASTPCLATRFPYGTLLTEEKLKQVEAGEAFLKNLGFFNVRLRVHGAVARIEVDETQMAEVMQNKREIDTYIKELGFDYVTLDLNGFVSGSMDKRINHNAKV